MEMQMKKSNDDLKTRAVIHASMLLAGQSRRGKHYKDIKRVYQIFFLKCNLFPESGQFCRRYNYREAKEHDCLSNATEIIFFEMSKLEQRVKDIQAGKLDINSLPDDEKWCIYMRYRHEEYAAELIEKLSVQEEGIMKAELAVAGISRSYLRYARKMAEIKDSMDRAQEIYNMKEEARAEGLAEGKAEGHAEGKAEGREEERVKNYNEKLEIAKKMKEMGDSVDKIFIVTGLAKDAIERL